MSDEEVSQYATPFVTSLFTMVNDPSNVEHICWNDSGDSIVIKYSFHFESKLLPKYFKTSKFCSFIRQLNVYGFHKVGDDTIPHGGSAHKEGEKEAPTRVLYFQHQNFRKGQSNLLKNIRRRNSSKRQVNGAGTEEEKHEKHDKHETTTPSTPIATPATPSTSSSSSGSNNANQPNNVSKPSTPSTPNTSQNLPPLSPDPVHYLMEEVGRLQHALQLVVGQLKVTKSRVDFLENELHQRTPAPAPQQVYMPSQPIYQLPPQTYYISSPPNMNTMNNIHSINTIPEATQLHFKKPTLHPSSEMSNGAYDLQNSGVQIINPKVELVSSPVSSFSTPSQTPPTHIPPTPPILIASSHVPRPQVIEVNHNENTPRSNEFADAYANGDYQYLSLEQLLSDITGNSALSSSSNIPVYENISS